MADGRQLENLVMDLERLALCKEGSTTLTVQLVSRQVRLTDKDSDMAALHSRLRQAEEQLAIVLAKSC